MNFSRLAATLALTATVATTACDSADAQCATCPQPTVAYSPVVAPQPVVYQNNTYNGWYPGKYLSRLFSWSSPTVVTAPVATQPTFVTAAYRPTYPPSYTTYSAAYSVARPVSLAPSYAVSYGGDCCGSATSYYPATLSAAPSCCNACSGYGCSSCSGGVVSAGYEAPAAGCSSCAGGQTWSPQAAPQQNYVPQSPTPAIPPGAAVPETRVNRQPVQEPPVADPAAGQGVEGGDTTWWDPPQLFDNRDRSAARPSTQSPSTTVWNAVYHQQNSNRTATVQRTAYRPAPAPAPRNKQVGAGGWRSAD